MLLGGELKLDSDYNCGFEGNPGTRFIVNLRTEPIEHVHKQLDETASGSKGTAETQETGDTVLLLDDNDDSGLSENLNVLFVDDDPILRKLFSRTIKTVAPQWNIREAANGETAIRLTQEQHFDLIFMDMYMASVEKQLLGTEAVKVLRARGVRCRICGLSANDKETEFLEAGADVFASKPIPCDPPFLRQELQRILYQSDSSAP